MKLLLDTMAFLWWVTDDPRLPQSSRDLIKNSENSVYFSAASAWEIAIKSELGRLKVKKGLAPWISAQLRKNHFTALPITIRHAVGVSRLPRIHRDPFDRMLISQCRFEKSRIITNDSEIRKYDVVVIW